MPAHQPLAFPRRPHRRRSWPLLLLAMVAGLLSLQPAFAQQRKIPFDRMTVEDGLPHRAVNAIVQDDTGFMWFGTQDGLARYDGNRFLVFRNDRESVDSISNNWVWTLLKDSKGRLWIGTNQGGLNLWMPNTRSFVHYRNDEMNGDSISNDRVRSLMEDRRGRIWVGTESGLNVFDPATQIFKRYLHDPSNPGSLGHNQVRSIHQDSEGIIWVGTNGGGLDRLDSASGRFSHLRHDPEDPNSLSQDRVRTIFEDRSGSLWVGTYEGGLNRLDRESGRFERFEHDPLQPSSLSDDRVRAVFQDQDGVIWVGTDDGLNEWLPERGEFASHRSNLADPTSLNDNQIMSIHQDRGGVIWVGTQGGVNKWNAVTGSFSGFRHDPGKPETSLVSNTVACFSESRDGQLWIGTYQGLDRLDPDSGRVRHFRHKDGDPSTLRDERVMSLFTDSDDTLWVGTYEGGLHRLDSANGRFTNYRNDPEDPSSLSRDAVTAIYEDSHGVLWVGTYRGGLNRFNEKRTAFIRYQNDPENAASLGSDQVLSLLEGSGGELWIGTDGSGLNAFERTTGSFTRYRHDPENPNSLSNNTVFSLLEASDGTLWVGTQGGGLNKWTKQDREANRVRFHHYNTHNGLPNEVIYGILEDDAGTLWLSTNEGLVNLDPKTERIRSYDTTHGLLSKEFNFGAFWKKANGEMIFGGNEGFNSFHPAAIRSNAHVPPVIMTSFLKFNKEVETEAPLSELKEIELSHKDYVVSFEFAALDYSAPKKNRYAYRLEGFETDWNEVGNLNRATYTNLDPGSYTLRVKAANNDGLWNETGLSIPIRVVPPPWKTWWVYLLYGLGTLAAVLAVLANLSGRRRKDAQRRRSLERQVVERTSELALKNRDLQDAISKVELASVTDALTGLRNRRFLVNSIDSDLALVDRYYEDLKRHPETTVREAQPDTLLLIFDLDGFKGVNDTYGHAAGDRVLFQVTDLLEASCRESDTIIRWGGDEFLIVARRAHRRSAEDLAERLRASVAAHEFELGLGKMVHLTCSIGFAFYPFLHRFPKALSWEQINAIADRALYISKKSNRDAWVGIFEGEQASNVHPSAFVQKINHELDELVRLGIVTLSTSIKEEERLVWAWA
ncbi:MAG: diguanylate cyclase [Acidobacteria bacterium]|nr:diguanylate cyclase [Acidobacteriota bacterium]